MPSAVIRSRAAASPVDRTLRRARFGATAALGLVGVLCAVWTARSPALQDKLHLSAFQMGSNVLAWGLGAVATLHVGGRVIRALGSRRTLRLAVPGAAVALTGMGLAPGYPALLVATGAFGLCMGLFEVALNVQAVRVEQGYRRPVMSAVHAGWCVGAVLGGAVGAAAAQCGAGFTATLGLVGPACLPVAVLIGTTHLPDDAAPGAERARRSRLPPALLLLGAVMFCGFVAEGAVADWGALYLRDTLGAAQSAAALAYPLFESAMLAGRSVADRATARLGTGRVLAAGGLLAAAGCAIAVGAPTTGVALLGFCVVGSGICVVAPLVLTSAGRELPTDPAAAIGRVTAMGYTGLLVGPVAIGFLADQLSLRAALALLVPSCLLVVLGGNARARVEAATDRSA